MEKIRLFEMFAGYGGASWGLKKANIDFECIGYSEIKKHAIQCYNQNFPNIKNFGDCTKINPKEIPSFNLLTAGFPCQSFSMCGNRQGFDDSRGTLFYDIMRIANEKKPRYMILENVEGLINHEEGKTFKSIISFIRRIGYDVIYKVLNSKDYGTPQSRKRIWMICKLGSWEFMEFQFPNKEPLKLTWQNLKDDSSNYKKVKKTPSRDEMRINCKNITNEPIIQTLTTKQDRFPNAGIIDYEDYYRFLTPKECFRCMGFFDDEIKLDKLSIAQCYDLAGDGWDINLVSKILKNLFIIKQTGGIKHNGEIS